MITTPVMGRSISWASKVAVKMVLMKADKKDAEKSVGAGAALQPEALEALREGLDSGDITAEDIKAMQAGTPNLFESARFRPT